jgi:uncharacterized protein (DUF58 family)
MPLFARSKEQPSTAKPSGSDPLADLNPKGAYSDLGRLLCLRFAGQELKLTLKRPVKSQLNGAERTRVRGRGMDFEEVRLYQPGDDVRSIDWRVTARTQVPHTKLYREERERPVFVVADQRASLFFGSRQCFKSVLANHIAANLAWAALSNGDRIGGLVFGDRRQRDIRPRRSKHAVLELLHQLQEFNRELTSPVAPADSQTLVSVLADVRRIARPGSSVFIVSDFYDYSPRCEQQLFELARHTEVSLIHVYDPLEKQLHTSSRLTVSNGQTRLQLPSDEASFQQAYEMAFGERLDQLTQSAKHLGLPLLSYATSDNLQQLLRERFAARK